MMDDYNYIIRPYETKDYKDILDITKNIWEGQDYLPKLINKFYESKYCYPYVVEINGKVISVVNTHFFTPNWVWLESIRTHPEYQGKGIASKLSKYQISKIIELGGKEAWLLTSADNKVTFKMLTNFKFKEIQQIKLWSSKDIRYGEELKAPNFKGLVDGNLIDINYLSLYINSHEIELSKQWKPINSFDELKYLFSKLNTEQNYLFSEFMIFPLDSYFVPELIDNHVFFQLNNSSIMTFQPSHERENRYVISINDSNPDIILSALLYGYHTLYNSLDDQETQNNAINLIIFYPSDVIIPILENCKHFRIMRKQIN